MQSYKIGVFRCETLEKKQQFIYNIFEDDHDKRRQGILKKLIQKSVAFLSCLLLLGRPLPPVWAAGTEQPVADSLPLSSEAQQDISLTVSIFENVGRGWILNPVQLQCPAGSGLEELLELLDRYAYLDTAEVSNAVNGDTFNLTYEGNNETAVGNYTAKVTDLGNDNYTLTGATGVELTWSIGGASIAGAAVDLSETEFTYTGQSQKPTVTVKLNGNTLNANTDYTVTYDGDTTNAGTVTVKVSGKGNYAGTTSKTFTIAKAPLTITGVDVQSKTYDGTTAATVTGVSFKGLVNGEALAMGVDYTATADFADASAGTGKSITGKVTLLSSTVGKNYTLNGGSFTTSGDISAAASKLSFKVDRTKPVKGQYITFSVTPQIKGDNRSFLQRVLGINAPKVEFWVNGTTKLGEVKVEEGKTSTFAYDTDKGGLKLGKNTITAEFTGDGNLKGCTESVVVYLHDSTTSAPTGDTSNIQTWTVVLAVSAVVLIGLGVGAVIYRKKKK